MDPVKTGAVILSLRSGLGLTQKQLAERLHISDKTVSKWEREQGCPDVSLLPALSRARGVKIEKILAGDISPNDSDGGNMKKIKCYVCPACGSVTTGTGEAEISCCGKPLKPLQAAKHDADHVLDVEAMEDEWFLSAVHEMTKGHYISFVAFVNGERMLLCKQYPEWNLQLRLPNLGHGKLYFYCTQHGLFEQII